MNVRPMKLSDADKLAELEEKYFSIPWSRESIVDSFKLDNYRFVVAEESEDIVGYCALYIAGDEADITNVVVDEAFRRKKIASKLLDFLFEEARKAQVKKVHLEVRKSNESAIALYEKVGFEKIGERKNFYDKPREDAILMSIEL